MKSLNVIGIFLLLVMLGCKNPIPLIKSSDVVSHGIELMLNDSISADRVYPQAKIYLFNSKEYLAYLPIKRDAIYLYNLASNKLEITFAIPLMNKEIEISDFDMIRPDSVALLSSNTNSVILVNNKGLFKRYDFRASIPEYNTNYVMSPPLSVVDGYIVAAMYPSTSVVGDVERNKYFSTARDAVFDIHDDALRLVNQTANFPEVYRKNYYYSFNPVRTIVNNQLLYSFEISNEISLYATKDFSAQTKTLEPYKFKLRKPFDEDKLMDHSYVGNYLHQADRYFAMLYDAYHQKYVRVQQIGSDEKLKADGSVNMDNAYNLLVYDANLKLAKVIQFPADARYDFRKVLISKNGILVRKNVPDSLKFKVLRYEQFKLF